MNKVALLIPHFNNPKGLIKSLKSIDLTENIDIVIVDDGSLIDKINEDEMNGHFKANGKLIFLYLEFNKGIEYALNYGIDYILKNNTYKYIARLDCGDLCLENRFKLQEDFLHNNPEIKLLGCNAEAINEEGDLLYTTVFPEKHNFIKKQMYKKTMFLHPCVMFSSQIISKIGKYPLNYKYAEDYAFFFKIVKTYKTHNLQKTLVQYEINPNGISLLNRKKQVLCGIKIIIDSFYFGFWPIYGLIRSFALYLLPNKILVKIKKSMAKNLLNNKTTFNPLLF